MKIRFFALHIDIKAFIVIIQFLNYSKIKAFNGFMQIKCVFYSVLKADCFIESSTIAQLTTTVLIT